MKFKAASPTGDTVKGEVLLFLNEKDAQEFNIPADGNKFGCYVLTAPKDILSVRTAITLADGVEEFVDCVVDGVLRATSQIKKGKGKKTTDKTVFDKVLFYRFENGRKRGLKMGQIEVASRDSTKVLSKGASSCVGCIELQLWRKYPEEESSASASTSSEADEIKRAPDFEKCPRWSDLKPSEGPTEFEVAFSNETKHTKPSKDRISEAREGFKFFASCTFRLASAENLRKLKYKNVPDYPDGSVATSEPKAEEQEIVASPSEDQDTTADVPAEDECSKKELPVEKSQVEDEHAPPAPKAASKPKTTPLLPEPSAKSKETITKPKSTPALAESVAFSFSVPENNVDVQFDTAFSQIIKNDVELKAKDISSSSSPRKKTPKKKGMSLFGISGGVASKLPRSIPPTEETPEKEPSPSIAEDASKKTNEGPDNYDDIFTFSSMEDEPSTPKLATEAPEVDGTSTEGLVKDQEWQPMTPPPSARKPVLEQISSENIRSASEDNAEPADAQEAQITASSTFATDAKPQTPATAIEPIVIDSQSTQSFNNTQENSEAIGASLSESLDTSKVPTPALVQESSYASNTTEAVDPRDVARVISEPSHLPVNGLGISTPQIEERGTPDTAVGHFSPVPGSPILGSSPPLLRRVSFGSATIIPSPFVKLQEQNDTTVSRSRSSTQGQMDWEQTLERSSSPLLAPEQQHTATCTPESCLSHVLAGVLRESIEVPVKRKADEITEPEEFQPRKRSETPAAKFTEEFQRRTMGAQARIAAAQKEMQRLEEETKEALAFEAQREAVLRLEMQAQRMEKENAERKARIDAIYGN